MNQVEWVPIYRNEESLCDAILQRQNRLRELRSKVLHQDKSDELTPLKTCGGEPKIDVSKLDKEITFLQERYYEQLDRMEKLGDVANLIGPNAEECVLLRKHRDRYGRTFSWLKGREHCADFGGCCGRPCGCCEKPLRTYLRPTDDGGKEFIEILGHCTGECACCIRFQGSYKKHKSLPATAFSPPS